MRNAITEPTIGPEDFYDAERFVTSTLFKPRCPCGWHGPQFPFTCGGMLDAEKALDKHTKGCADAST